MSQYIYLLQEREFIKTNENIYKIGKSKQDNLKRFHQYPKGSILLFQIICNNCDIVEKQIIHIFIDKFIQRTDVGSECFEGDKYEMISIIYDICIANKTINNNINKEIIKPNEPKVITEPTQRFYREQDLIAQFILDKIEETDENEDKLLIEQIYLHYKTWFKVNTISTKSPLTRSQLQIQLGRTDLFTRNKIAEGKWINMRIKEII